MTEEFEYDDQLRRMSSFIKELTEHVNRKDEQYGSSWRKRGGTGAFFVICRKWDRIEQAAAKKDYNLFKLFEDDLRSESILDDCLDLMGYLLVLIDYMYHTDVINQDDLEKIFRSSMKKQKRRVSPEEVKEFIAPRSGPPRRRRQTEQENPRGFDEEEDVVDDPIEGVGRDDPN